MAKKDFYVHIDGNQNEIQNWSFQQLASDPGTPFTGQFWLNTTDGKFKYYDGTSTQTVADAGDVAGLLEYKGGYNASTNTPDLDVSPSGVEQGNTYTVTAAGNFFTEAVEIGDTLISNVDNPTALSDWTRVQNNVDQATETVRGVAEIATQAEVNAGTDDLKFITPLKLATLLAASSNKFAVDLDDAEGAVSRAFGGGQTTYTVTHNLGTSDVVVQVKEISSGENVGAVIDTTGANTIDVIFNGNSTNGTFRVVVVG